MNHDSFLIISDNVKVVRLRNKFPLVLVGFVCNSLGRAVYNCPLFLFLHLFQLDLLSSKFYFMKILCKNALFIVSLFALFAFKMPTTAQLTIELKNVNFNLGGTLFLMVVDKNDQPLSKITRAASEKNAIFLIKDLPIGEYAVRAFHDENNNGKLDKGIFGQPIEGWGVSNDARGFMSAPPFKKMLVKVDKATKIAFKIDY